MQVTQSSSVASGVQNGSIYGVIEAHSELRTTTSTAGGCDYVGERQEAGVSFGPMTVTGLSHLPITVTPRSFIDGSLYLGEFNGEANIAPGSEISATVDDGSGAVVSAATMPRPLVAVLSPSISRTAGVLVEWEAGASEAVEIEISDSGLGTSQTLRCRTEDSGRFVLLPEALAQLVPDSSDDQAWFSLRRIDSGTTTDPHADLELSLEVASELARPITLDP